MYNNSLCQNWSILVIWWFILLFICSNWTQLDKCDNLDHLYMPCVWLHRVSPDLCKLWRSRTHPVSAVWKGSGFGSQHHDVWSYRGFRLPTQNVPPKQPVHLPSMSSTLPVLRRARPLWLPDLRSAQLPPQYEWPELTLLHFFCILLLLRKQWHWLWCL